MTLEKAERRILKLLRTNGPDWFNDMNIQDRFDVFKCVFNEYVREVAIPKNWEFTKTIKEWPLGNVKKEKMDVLQNVLGYPDLVLFAMENYGVFVDAYAPEGISEKYGVGLCKLSKHEASLFCRTLRKDYEENEKNRPITDKWDERELREDMVLDHIKNIDKLNRRQRVELQVYILHKFAEKVGIPVPPHDKDIAIDLEKRMQENSQTIKEVLKRKQEFFWFAFTNYEMLASFGIDKNNEEIFTLRKIPEETENWMFEIMESRELTEEEMKRMWDETRAADKFPKK